MWIRTKNGESVKPPVKEEARGIVIVRKGYDLIPETQDEAEHWEYDEWQMTAEQYEVFAYYETLVNEQSDALLELAELISEVV